MRLLSLLLLCAATACASQSAERDRRALALESSPKELVHKAEASSRAGDLTRAEQYYVAALKAGGEERPITKKLLVVCAADQRYPAAIEYAEQYLYRHPDDVEFAFAAASLHAAVGEALRARELLELVLRKKPEWAEPHYVLATVLRQQGAQSELADQHDLAYLRLTPNGKFAETARARLSRTQ